jgi:transcriptional regulator with XRE-family HTH domain
MKLSLADGLKSRRKRLHLTQIDAASRIGTSQSRLAKMESADPSVSIDLLIKAFLSLGATPRDVGRTFMGAATPVTPTARKRAVGWVLRQARCLPMTSPNRIARRQNLSPNGAAFNSPGRQPSAVPTFYKLFLALLFELTGGGA